jgi:hypothetical protein
VGQPLAVASRQALLFKMHPLAEWSLHTPSSQKLDNATSQRPPRKITGIEAVQYVNHLQGQGQNRSCLQELKKGQGPGSQDAADCDRR